jgi:biopolymer transport protein ExbB
MSITKRLTAFFTVPALAGVTALCLLTASPAALADEATAAPAVVAVAAAATVDTEKVTNPYGLDALWKTGDFVAKGTLMILVIMSMGSWYVIITKLVAQHKMFKQARGADQFWKTDSIADGINTLEAGSAFRFIAESAQQASQHHGGKLAEKIDRNTWMSMQIQRATDNVQSHLQEGLAVLATVGSTAPFVGLFGTVWGIYHALTAIGIAGQASIDKVAGPVGEALIMTAIGLAVAVPAVLGYNWLVRRNKVAMEKVRAFSADIHAITMGATGKVS